MSRAHLVDVTRLEHFSLGRSVAFRSRTGILSAQCRVVTGQAHDVSGDW